MIRVAFDPAKLADDQQKWWLVWADKAQSARDQLKKDRAAGVEHHFRQPVWAELKLWLLKNVFGGKCAYCETLVTAGFVGDAEHYRPKGGVRTAQNKVAEVGGTPHPGYYWLCYDWKNIIPACELCNSTHKRTRFPLKNDTQYSSDDSLDTDSLNALEEPLLLHPYSDPNPEECFVFGVRGMVAAKNADPHAQATIDVCGLNREDLAADRHRHQRSGKVEFFNSLARVTDDDGVDELWREVAANPYSLAVKHAILQALAKGRPKGRTP